MGKLKEIIFKISLLIAYIFGKITKTNNGIAILTYHNIVLGDEPNKTKYTVSIGQFKKQMEYLKSNNYITTDFNEVINYINSGTKTKDKKVIITFDDGFRNIFLRAYPIIKSLNYKATVFITADYIGKNVIFPWLKKSFIKSSTNLENSDLLPLTWEQVKEMSQHGVNIGGHGLTHQNLATLEEAEIFNEIFLSKRKIEEELGENISFFSYPYEAPKCADTLNKVREILIKCNYQCACSTNHGVAKKGSDLFNIARIDINSSDTINWFKIKVEGDTRINKVFSNLIKFLIKGLFSFKSRIDSTAVFGK